MPVANRRLPSGMFTGEDTGVSIEDFTTSMGTARRTTRKQSSAERSLDTYGAHVVTLSLSKGIARVRGGVERGLQYVYTSKLGCIKRCN